MGILLQSKLCGLSETVFCSKEKAQKSSLTGYQTPQKKTVLPKNCFVVLSYNKDDPILCLKSPEAVVYPEALEGAFIVGFSNPTKA